jgi:hypothetical protein
MPETFNKITDVPRVCKGIADAGSTSISEAEMTTLITAYAKHLHPDMKPDAAFAKVFTANDETGIAFRQAVQIAKGLALVMPVYVGGDAALAVDDPADALAQIEELVEQQRAAHPELSKAQVFAKVYAANPELARREAGSSGASSRNATTAARRTQLVDMFNALPQILGSSSCIN